MSDEFSDSDMREGFALDETRDGPNPRWEDQWDEWIARHDAKIKAEAKAEGLREAANDWREHLHATQASYSCAESWLNARANQIEKEAQG